MGQYADEMEILMAGLNQGLDELDGLDAAAASPSTMARGLDPCASWASHFASLAGEPSGRIIIPNGIVVGGYTLLYGARVTVSDETPVPPNTGIPIEFASNSLGIGVVYRVTGDSRVRSAAIGSGLVGLGVAELARLPQRSIDQMEDWLIRNKAAVDRVASGARTGVPSGDELRVIQQGVTCALRLGYRIPTVLLPVRAAGVRRY